MKLSDDKNKVDYISPVMSDSETELHSKKLEMFKKMRDCTNDRVQLSNYDVSNHTKWLNSQMLLSGPVYGIELLNETYNPFDYKLNKQNDKNINDDELLEQKLIKEVKKNLLIKEVKRILMKGAVDVPLFHSKTLNKQIDININDTEINIDDMEINIEI